MKKRLTLVQLFLNHGFSIEEAKWAKENELDPKTDSIKKLLLIRLSKVLFFLKHTDMGKEEIIDMLEAEQREYNIDNQREEYNIYSGFTI